MPPAPPARLRLAGIVNDAQQFSGSTALNAPGGAFNWAAGDSFSIEYWIKPDGTSGVEVVVGRDDGGNSVLQWWTGIWDGEAAFVLADKDPDGEGLGLYLRGTTDLRDDSWHHVVAVRDADAGMNRIFVDGEEENSVAVTYTAGFDVSVDLNIGWINNTGGTFNYNGILDEVAVYGRALSPTEIEKHYQNGLDGKGYCEVEPTPTPDIDGDGDVDAYDLHLFILAFGTSAADCDFNMDGVVDALDLGIFAGEYGSIL